MKSLAFNFKGEQTLFIEAKADTLIQLVEIAKIQSTKASSLKENGQFVGMIENRICV